MTRCFKFPKTKNKWKTYETRTNAKKYLLIYAYKYTDICHLDRLLLENLKKTLKNL